MNSLVTTSPAEKFRAKAAGALMEAANMTLHDLVDEFQRLQDVIDQNTTINDNDYAELNEVAELAQREQRIVTGAARARFGITFEAYDRKGSAHSGW